MITGVIAAIETNHQGDPRMATRLVQTAGDCGCVAVKLPVCSVRDSYTAEFLAQPCHDYPELGDTMGRVLQALQLDEAGIQAVRTAARPRLAFIGAPWDLPSVEVLDRVDVDAFQVDPPVLSNFALVREIARRGKAVFVAAGMCSEREVDRAMELLGGLPVTILHCVVGAPGLAGTALGYLAHYRERYHSPVGYLSLEADGQAALVASALGASHIQRPLTIDRALRGPMHARSADREELAALVRAIGELKQASAAVSPRELLPVELETFGAGRTGLVAARDLRAGATIASDMLVAKAPLKGVSPALVDLFVGRKLLYDVPADGPLTFGMIDL